METSPDQAPATSAVAFFKWCKQYLQQRGWGRFDEAAARYLRQWGLVTRGEDINIGSANKLLLDAVPQARITKARLIEAASQGDDAGEAEWVLPAGTNLRGQPTYLMRTILSDRWVNGTVEFLTTTEPTWEPAANLPSNEITQYRRRVRRRTEGIYIEVEAQQD
ncbi:unnamed protein product [Phytophthora fragariaefolia]|uniref:Unnamed protein product n=1 Tax=Phytophthora fragariaefolia TaxID=1490495 RepID=A0A9W6XLB0_9STRA|nr:unnamed protein product [Phytophthora fragariaefolia]